MMTDRADTGAVSLPASDVSIERPALYVVATPIGNLADLSQRAVVTLANVDFVLSEDTRRSRRLFEHYAINTPLFALHEHNEKQVVQALIERLCADVQACALISDAGTPLISDPGFALVQSAIAAGIPVIPIPGACAAIAALSVAGLPTASFVYEGFLPAQARAREQRLSQLSAETRTLVFYEAPHRIEESVQAMQGVFGADRPAVIARELTKRFETIYRGTLGELVTRLSTDVDARRGEFVVIVGGSQQRRDELEARKVLGILLAETDLKTAVRLATALTEYGRNELYQLALELREDDDRVDN